MGRGTHLLPTGTLTRSDTEVAEGSLRVRYQPSAQLASIFVLLMFINTIGFHLFFLGLQIYLFKQWDQNSHLRHVIVTSGADSDNLRIKTRSGL